MYKYVPPRRVSEQDSKKFGRDCADCGRSRIIEHRGVVGCQCRILRRNKREELCKCQNCKKVFSIFIDYVTIWHWDEILEKRYSTVQKIFHPWNITTICTKCNVENIMIGAKN